MINSDMPFPAPKADTGIQSDCNYYKYSKLLATQMDSRKRMYSSYASMDQIKEQDQHRQIKMKRLQEFEQESKNESVISTDKASEISSAHRFQTQRHVKPTVSMTNILKNLSLLK
jgi:hypothetical protein